MSVDSGIGAEDLASIDRLQAELEVANAKATIRRAEAWLDFMNDRGNYKPMWFLPSLSMPPFPVSPEEVCEARETLRRHAIDAGEPKTPKPIGNTSVNTCDDAVTDKMIEAGVERLNHHYSDKRLSFTKTAVSDIYRAMRAARE